MTPTHTELEKELDTDGRAETEHPEQGPRRHRLGPQRPQIRSQDRTGHHRRAMTMTHLLSVVAHPDPTAPMAGKPRLPKISTQLKKTLARLATRMTTTMGATRPMAWRLCLRTMKP